MIIKLWRRCFGHGVLVVIEMKMLSRIAITVAALSMGGGFAYADSADQKNGSSYSLPTVVHGKTSMREAIGSNSTFSFKLFQVDDSEAKPRQPYSYPEPDDSHR